VYNSGGRLRCRTISLETGVKIGFGVAKMIDTKNVKVSAGGTHSIRPQSHRCSSREFDRRMQGIEPQHCNVSCRRIGDTSPKLQRKQG